MNLKRHALAASIVAALSQAPAVLAQDDPFATAELAYANNKLDAAAEGFNAALTAAKEGDDEVAMGRALSGLASVHLERGEHAKARARAEEALELFKDARDYGWRATARYQLGQVAIAQWRADPEQSVALDSALKHFDDAGDDFRSAIKRAKNAELETRLTQWYGEAFTRQAEILALQKEDKYAARNYEKAAKQFVKAELPLAAADAWYQAAEAFIRMEDRGDADEAYETAAQLFLEGGDAFWSGLATAARGHLQLDARRFDDAVPHFESAAALLEEKDAPARHQLYAVFGLAESALFLGDTEAASQHFDRAHALASAENLNTWLPLIEVRRAQLLLDSDAEAAYAAFKAACPTLDEAAAASYRLECHLALGDAKRAAGDKEAAAEEDASALVLLDEVDTFDPKRKKAIKPKLLSNSAELLFERKEWDAARDAYTDLLKRVEEPLEEARLLRRLAQINFADGDAREAHDNYEDAIKILKKEDAYEKMAVYLLEDAKLSAREDEYKDAYKAASKAYKAYDKAGKDLDAARTRVRYAEYLLLAGKERKAESVSGKASRDLAALDKPVESALALLLAAESLGARGKPKRSLARIFDIIETLEPQTGPDGRQAIFKAYVIGGEQFIVEERFSDAKEYYTKGFAVMDSLGPETVPPIIRARAYVSLAALEDDKAESHYTTALALFKESESRVGQGRAHEGLGDLRMKAKDSAGAAEHYTKALELFAAARRPKLSDIAEDKLKSARKLTD